MIKIIHHGAWVQYTPDKPIEGVPENASIAFAKRESDGVDWYQFIRTEGSFAEGSVLATAMWQDFYNEFVVGPAVYDAQRLFPANQILLEITGYTGDNPQRDLGDKILRDDKFFDIPKRVVRDLARELDELKQLLTAKGII
jgi:hypothetical protein